MKKLVLNDNLYINLKKQLKIRFLLTFPYKGVIFLDTLYNKFLYLPIKATGTNNKDNYT